jgi:dethiobiotin synthetase/adenosylmethionine--8-amino-7-oxononanoate aminotransferase
VLAVELAARPGGQRGYGAAGAVGVARRLRAAGVFARPLGNVAYLMVTPTTRPATAARLLAALAAALDEGEA